MNDKRYKELDSNINAQITPEEYEQGWHFCPDWDGMLIGPGMIEFEECCSCSLRRVYD